MSARPPTLRPVARAKTPEQRAHLEWLGFVQPVGLVVSLPALEKAQCFVSRHVGPHAAVLARLLGATDKKDAPADALLPELSIVATELLGWREEDLSTDTEALSAPVKEYGDVLSPSFVVRDGATNVALVVELAPRTPLDAPLESAPWPASPEARIERLLRETEIPIGILTNGEAVRLVYAPRGESAGYLTFELRPMREPSGRAILAALVMLLGSERLFELHESQRLPRILAESRRYQNEVSTRLAEQVLAGLYALLRGIDEANAATEGTLLRETLAEDPSQVYGGLLTTVLRLVFLLYAEDRGLLPREPTYAQHYAVAGLFEKLREDEARNPDTMGQRYGAWPRLLSVFRLVHDGGSHGTMRLPPRFGRLFDPDAYTFLEGRPHGSARQAGETITPPRMADGVILAVLENLLLLDGERLSYRALDVEQIGSVYEAMMGFTLLQVEEPSITLRGKKKKGAPSADPVVGLDALLAAKGKARIALLAEQGVELPGKQAKEVESAGSEASLLAALGKRISPLAPDRLAAGALALQPTEERRRSGSHYTPRSLTEPIVEKTLAPLFPEGEIPEPSFIQSLKVCDLAMGSGAFLVAACRWLGDRLVASWQKHGAPAIAPDEDLVLHARRVVAQQCLYGVDKNPFAVDLAKLSLWLVTLAKDQPFTFVDHALRHGDSLVGLDAAAIARFHWDPDAETDPLFLQKPLREATERASALRREIQALAESGDTMKKRYLLDEAEAATARVRRVGDLVIDAFFSAAKDKDRKAARNAYADRVREGLDELPEPEHEQTPFHWPLEFPEVFDRENPGFDAFVGNPPFAGKNTLTAQCGDRYLDFLLAAHEGAHGNADLVAHFFRRAFKLLRQRGTFGLIATNTIAQGDTRGTGLRWIRKHGGFVYDATRRYRWPNVAAVIVSVVHVSKRRELPARLDGQPVERITAFLFHAGLDDDPLPLKANANKAFVGSYVLGMGFTFDDTNSKATPIAEMHRLIAKNPRNAERIFPYLGGEEINTSPTHAHHRYVINFGDLSEEECRKWPDLFSIVEAKVRGTRGKHSTAPWWQFERPRAELFRAVADLESVLAIARVSQAFGVARIYGHPVLSDQAIVVATGANTVFAVTQSRIHETWARVLASSMKDDLRYTPTDCFETFPFPLAWDSNATLEDVGRAYYEYRAALMVRSDEGLTTTYNRFHDPNERDPGILRLRELHDAMDRAVLNAYGWTDIQPSCDFLLDYEDDEEDDDAPKKRRKKKPWRYRWPDATRDEVLARLLALNAERAAEEKRQGEEAALTKPAEPTRAKKTPSKKPGADQGNLF